MTIAFKAYAKDGHVTAETPRKAAEAFFSRFPTKRKCDVIQGEHDGLFFTVKYGRLSLGQWPQQFKDVTKKTAATLPDAL